MKTVLKTIVLCVVVVFALFLSIKIHNSTNALTTENSRLELAPNDPTVQLLMNRVNSSDIFRSAGFSTSNLKEDDVIAYVFDNLTKDDYSTKKVEHKKSLCEVTGKILFTSTSDCNVKIISNDVFTSKIKNDFNVDFELSKKTFDYHGHFCKNDGKKYYCLLSKYTYMIKHFSVVKEAYEEDNKLVIKEYYFFVDLNDRDTCNLYLNVDYCEKKNVNEEVVVDEDIIKNNGVLYQHEFEHVDDNYYYLQSFVVSER